VDVATIFKVQEIKIEKRWERMVVGFIRGTKGLITQHIKLGNLYRKNKKKIRKWANLLSQDFSR
jgi:hypothetical protein